MRIKFSSEQDISFVEENDDSDISDVFLQCCLFGGVIYG